MTAKRSPGRPPLPQEKRRNQRIVTFLTESQDRVVKALARDEGKSVSRMCYELLEKGIDAYPRPDGEAEAAVRPLARPLIGNTHDDVR